MLSGRERLARADARRLARLLAGIKAKVNLIPLNAAAGHPVRAPVGRHGRRLRAHPGRTGRHRLGAQEPRPRHPRRLRAADRRRTEGSVAQRLAAALLSGAPLRRRPAAEGVGCAAKAALRAGRTLLRSRPSVRQHGSRRKAPPSARSAAITAPSPSHSSDALPGWARGSSCRSPPPSHPRSSAPAASCRSARRGTVRRVAARSPAPVAPAP